MFRPLLIGQFTRRAFSWLPIIRVSLFLSLFHEREIYIYIYHISSNAHRTRCSHHQTGINLNAATRTRLVIRIIRSEGSASRVERVEIFRVEDSVYFAIQRGKGDYFSSYRGGEGVQGSLRYMARREPVRGRRRLIICVLIKFIVACRFRTSPGPFIVTANHHGRHNGILLPRRLHKNTQ